MINNIRPCTIKTLNGVITITKVSKDGVFTLFDMDTLTKRGRHLFKAWGSNTHSGKNNFLVCNFLDCGENHAWEDIKYSVDKMIKDFNQPFTL